MKLEVHLQPGLKGHEFPVAAPTIVLERPLPRSSLLKTMSTFLCHVSGGS